MSQVTEQSVRFQTALASIKLIQASAVLDRSEERFSRNAETDLVCRLLLEKKKKDMCQRHTAKDSVVHHLALAIPSLRLVSRLCLQLFFCDFLFNDTATTEIYTLSLHDALPISDAVQPLIGKKS